jgi:hypothetical protein
MKYSETKMESKIELINPSENIYLSYKVFFYFKKDKNSQSISI